MRKDKKLLESLFVELLEKIDNVFSAREKSMVLEDCLLGCYVMALDTVTQLFKMTGKVANSDVLDLMQQIEPLARRCEEENWREKSRG